MILNGFITNADRSALVASHTAPNLTPTVLCCDTKQPLIFSGPKSRPENGKGAGFISMLRALGLAPNHQAARLVAQLDGAIRHISMLAASARAATYRPFKVAIRDGYFGFGRFWQHGNGDRRGLYPSVTFGWWDTLPSMATTFVGEDVFSVSAANREDYNSRSLFYDFEVKETSAGRVFRKWRADRGLTA